MFIPACVDKSNDFISGYIQSLTYVKRIHILNDFTVNSLRPLHIDMMLYNLSRKVTDDKPKVGQNKLDTDEQRQRDSEPVYQNLLFQ